MVRPTDRFVAVGQTVRHALIEKEGLPAERIEVIYNGVEINTADKVAAADRAHDAPNWASPKISAW